MIQSVNGIGAHLLTLSACVCVNVRQEGESSVAVSTDSIRLNKDDTLLIGSDQPFRLVAATTTECSFLMSVVMDANRKI